MAGGWDLRVPAYEKSSARSGKTSFGDTLWLCGRLRQRLPVFCLEFCQTEAQPLLAVADFMPLVGVIIKLLRWPVKDEVQFDGS